MARWWYAPPQTPAATQRPALIFADFTNTCTPSDRLKSTAAPPSPSPPQPPSESSGETSSPASPPPAPKPRYQPDVAQKKRSEVTLNENDLEEKFVKGSGPGGQKINKNRSSVQLRHIPTGLIVERFRELANNRKEARKLLRLKLDELVNGENSVLAQRAAKKRRQAAKQRQRAKKKYGGTLDETPDGDDDDNEEDGDDDDDDGDDVDDDEVDGENGSRSDAGQDSANVRPAPAVPAAPASAPVGSKPRSSSISRHPGSK
ncbi:hypothetical protein HK105_202859 [Polyrhizophydium stewartii]|uniref:Prokaryotic-type class I peptide chain release factors domain-containing protein n=1 Tax=Polyrhizophydium stewartii TaxID=2732419 RepID=A0ABR4NDF5_9FUNG